MINNVLIVLISDHRFTIGSYLFGYFFFGSGGIFIFIFLFFLWQMWDEAMFRKVTFWYFALDFFYLFFFSQSTSERSNFLNILVLLPNPSLLSRFLPPTLHF